MQNTKKQRKLSKKSQNKKGAYWAALCGGLYGIMLWNMPVYAAEAGQMQTEAAVQQDIAEAAQQSNMSEHMQVYKDMEQPEYHFEIDGFHFENDTWYKVDENGNLDTAYTGMGVAATHDWCYFTDGVEDKSYTGMAFNDYGWWYYEDGKLLDDYTGIAQNTWAAGTMSMEILILPITILFTGMIHGIN